MLTRFARHWLTALQFFTRVPVAGRLGAWVGYGPAQLRASAAHFPSIGWLAAAAAGAAYFALHRGLAGNPFAPLAAAVACTIATVLLTGGFHEDGLADVADGLGGSADRDRALEIMKDSRIGAFGAMALALALLAKVALLAALGAHGAGPALVALAGAHVLSRFWPLLLMRTLAHVGDSARSKSKPLADGISGPALGVALLWCFPLAALVLPAVAAMFLIVPAITSGIALLWLRRLFVRRLGGFTGDCLGATQQVCEIAFYLGAALALPGR
ncbi:adenosylcobinamide-GDP ribazoletransferase [Ramlibacter sp. H39-3-26]|uniref:adenosylcobinamide-GDP ribazoletransferase n=1 Tax=Curvibacter soli TaxID=3031331 RepID=UPI0023DAF6B6|nr:adenosylcobinamide-GDP ribazoletransferase [Ramlibacter sp. H39-3-26]MDF1483729.1 adenosylcobinamide-GDP ribazoletransferase [Ramlibacter sp. H39-3-26]